MIDKINLSGCAIIESDKLLLLWKIKQKHYEFPGGKVERHETIESAALRECREEIGVNLELGELFYSNDFKIDNKLFTSNIYLAKITEDMQPEIKEKDVFRNILWMHLRDYKKYELAPNVIDFCEKYLKHL